MSAVRRACRKMSIIETRRRSSDPEIRRLSTRTIAQASEIEQLKARIEVLESRLSGKESGVLEQLPNKVEE